MFKGTFSDVAGHIFSSVGEHDTSPCPKDTDSIRNTVWDVTQPSQIVTKQCPDNFTGEYTFVFVSK